MPMWGIKRYVGVMHQSAASRSGLAIVAIDVVHLDYGLVFGMLKRGMDFSGSMVPWTAGIQESDRDRCYNMKQLRPDHRKDFGYSRRVGRMVEQHKRYRLWLLWHLVVRPWLKHGVALAGNLDCGVVWAWVECLEERKCREACTTVELPWL